MNKFSELYISYACAPKPCKWKHAFKWKFYMKYFKTQVEIHRGLPLERLFSLIKYTLMSHHRITRIVYIKSALNAYKERSKEAFTERPICGIALSLCMFYSSFITALWLLAILQMMKCDTERPFLQGFSQ